MTDETGERIKESKNQRGKKKEWKKKKE